MDHDFKQDVYDAGQGFEYRKYEYESADCRGLMDYIDSGVGWSKCSARDFSGYLTSAGTKEPCLPKRKTIKNKIMRISQYKFCRLKNCLFKLIYSFRW